jgi:putative ABC transport system permease protein
MWRLALRTLTAHRARLAMTLATVCVGTGFVAGTLAFSAAAERAERSIPQRGDVAVQVSPSDTQGHLPRSTVDDLAGLSGVVRADPVVSGPGSLLGRDGKVVENAGGVTNWADTARFTLTTGRAPAGTGEVAVSAAAARTSGVRVGDTVNLLLDESRHQASVVGLYDYRSLGREAAPALAFQTTAAQRLLGLPGRVSAVDLVAAPGVAAGELVSRAQAAVPGARVVDAQAENAEARERRTDELRTLRDALLGFAGVALLVGTLVIANTFSMLVGQRTRELALLRAVGMSRRQVRRMVLGEAVTIGLLGGVAGAAVGHGFAAWAVRFLDERHGPEPVALSWQAVLAALTVGVGVTALSAYAAARRAARTAPVTVLRSEATLLQADTRRRTIAGLILAVPAAVVYAYAALTDRIDEQVGMVGVGAAALLILAVVLLAPALCRVLLPPLSAPVGRLGATGRLAAGNAQRNPRRTAATASALMIGLSVVTGFAIFGQSLKDDITAGVRRDVPAQLVVQPAAGRAAAIPQHEVEQLAAVPGVRAVAALRYGYPSVRLGRIDTQAPLTAVDPAAIGTALRLSVTHGRTDDLPGGAFVTTDQARRYGLSVGDRITVRWPKGGERELPVTGVYRESRLLSGVLVPESVALPHLEPADAYVAFVTLAPGADEAVARAGLERAVADRPQVVVLSRSEYLDRRLGEVDVLLGVLYALLALAVVVGILGVVNTLALSVLERTREIGLLRALGLTRRQLRSAVRIESALVAVLGGLFGLAGGYLLGAMFQRAALRTGLLDAAVPLGQVALALGALAAAGVLAASWPARRAARTDPLTAIATE